MFLLATNNAESAIAVALTALAVTVIYSVREIIVAATQWLYTKITGNTVEPSDRTRVAHRQMQQIDAVLSEFRGKAKSQRTVVLVTHNGGGPASPGSPAYVTVLFQDADNKPGRVDGWETPFRIDSEYNEMLVKLMDEGGFLKITSRDLAGTFLGDLYERDGVEASWLELIKIEDEGVYQIYFVSMQFTKVPKDSDIPAIRANARRLADTLLPMLKTPLLPRDRQRKSK